MFTSKISQGPSTAVGKKGEKNSGNEVSQVVLFHSVFVFVFFAIPPPPVSSGPRLHYNLLGA